MSVKTNGAEFKKFYADNKFWPEGAYHDDAVIKINGIDDDGEKDFSSLADSDVVRIEGGIVVFPGENIGPSMENYFRRWLRGQSVRTIIVEVDASNLDAVIDAVRASGGKLKKE